ncbi:MAG: DUF1573 domain-containing protein [Chitinivibrionales bacterium]|nr:DUF1573 domain-containing protein [Chitinivibrionales bacterium]
MRHLGAIWRNWGVILLTVVLLSTAAWAKPIVKVDVKEYDAGTIPEGSKESITHEFTLRNTGDEPLKIIKVRPG